mmetsp:Transcript_21580/g.18612  ORF Transcript_21580/g.18612 Transcript_21580/m.18612 type:complete len:156 (+) Transcript_21580:59-526(+)
MSQIKLNIDNPDPSYVKSFWIKFFIYGALTYIIAYCAPSPLELKGTVPIDCPEQLYNMLQYNCQPFDIESNPVFTIITEAWPTNQFLTLEGVPTKVAGDTHTKSAYFDFEISVFELNFEFYTDNPVTAKDVVFKKKQVSIQFDCEYYDNEYCRPL